MKASGLLHDTLRREIGNCFVRKMLQIRDNADAIRDNRIAAAAVGNGILQRAAISTF